jgi:hypothetical protein
MLSLDQEGGYGMSACGPPDSQWECPHQLVFLQSFLCENRTFSSNKTKTKDAGKI